MKKIDLHAGQAFFLCDICRTILTEDDINKKTPLDYIDVCEKHREYAKIFLSDKISENLGYKDKEEPRKCGVCSVVLKEDEEQLSLKKNSFHYLCKMHLEDYHKAFNIEWLMNKNKVIKLQVGMRVKIKDDFENYKFNSGKTKKITKELPNLGSLRTFQLDYDDGIWFIEDFQFCYDYDDFKMV